mmetsp:Transcript_91275/g.260703  ORF Transcript_91275/g.260703 Transcript_91275/m.260703 type:complete len:194 (+) Transcript_91275:488-1069(+)
MIEMVSAEAVPLTPRTGAAMARSMQQGAVLDAGMGVAMGVPQMGPPTGGMVGMAVPHMGPPMGGAGSGGALGGLPSQEQTKAMGGQSEKQKGKSMNGVRLASLGGRGGGAVAPIDIPMSGQPIVGAAAVEAFPTAQAVELAGSGSRQGGPALTRQPSRSVAALEELEELRRRGLVNDGEYVRTKASLLDRLGV